MDDRVRTVDIVIPVYNEAAGLERFHGELVGILAGLEHDFTIYYVNDGSTDTTRDTIRKLTVSDARVVHVELSRNFGHQAALTAGLDLAHGDAVITMDGDGQHPPGLIAEMLRLAEIGYDIVLTQRRAGQQPVRWKATTSRAFYWLLGRLAATDILPNAGDYRLMSRSAVAALRGMREYHRFLRGMVSWMGFHAVILPYTERARFSGRPKYSLAKMSKLAADAIFSFSLVPLHLGLLFGSVFVLLALAESAYVLSFWLRGRQGLLAPGWSSLMFVVLIVGGILMTMIGFVGIYVGRIFQEVKRRPIYLVKAVEPRGTQRDVDTLPIGRPDERR